MSDPEYYLWGVDFLIGAVAYAIGGPYAALVCFFIGSSLILYGLTKKDRPEGKDRPPSTVLTGDGAPYIRVSRIKLWHKWGLGLSVVCIVVLISSGAVHYLEKEKRAAVQLASSGAIAPDEGKLYPGPGDDVNLPPLGPDDSFNAQAPRGPFAVYLGTAIFRQRENLAEGPYAQVVQGCSASTIVAIQYLTHISIKNRLPVKTFIDSYSVEVRTGRDKWEHLVHLHLIPNYKLYFFHSSQRLTPLQDMPLIDDHLRDHALEPGESISGFALFAFPKNHQPLAVSGFTSGSSGKGLVIGQFPLNDVRVSVIDSTGHSVHRVFAGREWNPDSIQPTTIHFKFGEPLPKGYTLTGYDLACNSEMAANK